MYNQTMIEYFEWNLPPDSLLWRRLTVQAQNLKTLGVDIIWLPPAYKGADGVNDVGYSVYDMYDLGEFDQKGSVATKYGTRDEYLLAIRALQEVGIAVLVDVVFNHRMGADETEQVQAMEFDPENRLHQISDDETILAWTKFNFPGRQNEYSDFQWNSSCFKAIDLDEGKKRAGLFLFAGKDWSKDVDQEKGNYDYLMGADVDMENPAVVDELIRWGEWYLKTTGADGFRLDAVKHISSSFFKKWIDAMRQTGGDHLDFIGEYWSGNLSLLESYLCKSGERIKLFDVPLHMNFRDASNSQGNYDMGVLFKNSLVSVQPDLAVTFVDNHDSQPGQALESWVEEWFKPLAYAIILLREGGLPCIFYADYYGLRDDGVPPVPGLKRMLMVRRRYAYGKQNDYFDHHDVVGWTREGDTEHPNSGCAVLMSDGDAGEKEMYIGSQHAGKILHDVTRRIHEPAEVGEDGNVLIKTPPGGVGIWLFQEAYEDIVIHFE